jgi:hypothetical protein
MNECQDNNQQRSWIWLVKPMEPYQTEKWKCFRNARSMGTSFGEYGCYILIEKSEKLYERYALAKKQIFT